MSGAFLTPRFWLDALERAVKSAAQGALSAFGADAIWNVFASDVTAWLAVGGFALGGFVQSVLMSIASAQIGSDDSASLVE